MSAETVVTFRADLAEVCLARFLAWAGGEVEIHDLGTHGPVRRYRVPAAEWSAYTQAKAVRR